MATLTQKARGTSGSADRERRVRPKLVAMMPPASTSGPRPIQRRVMAAVTSTRPTPAAADQSRAPVSVTPVAA